MEKPTIRITQRQPNFRQRRRFHEQHVFGSCKKTVNRVGI
jgi:hypothetical protein